MVSVLSIYRDMPFFKYFLVSIVILEKLIVCVINWCTGKSFLVSLEGICFLVRNVLLQNAHSRSVTGIKETESLSGPQLNCGYFPSHVRVLGPEPLEIKLHVAAASFPPAPGKWD